MWTYRLGGGVIVERFADELVCPLLGHGVGFGGDAWDDKGHCGGCLYI